MTAAIYAAFASRTDVPPVTIAHRPWSALGAGYTLGADNTWASGSPLTFGDVVSGQWVHPARLSSDTLRLRVSSDQGASWSVVGTGTVLAGRQLLSACQSSDGRVHVLTHSSADQTGFEYARLTLARDGGGLITGFSVDVSGVAVCSGGSGADGRGSIRVIRDQAGDECLAVGCNASSSGIIVYAQKTLTTTPANSAAWTRLDGSAGVTTVGTFANVNSSNHEHNAHFAQIGSTKALVFATGRIPAEADSDGSLSTVVCAASGDHTWSVGSPVTRTTGQSIVSMASADARVLILSNYISLATPGERTGLSIDSLDSAGTYARDWIAAPSSWDQVDLVQGAISCNAAATRVYVAHQLWDFLYGSTVRSLVSAYVGGSWTEQALDPDTADGDSWGIYGSTGIDGMLAVRLDDGDRSPWVAAVYAEPA